MYSPISTTRRRGAVAALLTSALFATACGSDGDSAGNGPTGPATAQSLTTASDRDPGRANIFAGQTDQMTELIYDKLLSPSPYVDDPQPWLATSVEQVD